MFICKIDIMMEVLNMMNMMIILILLVVDQISSQQDIPFQPTESNHRTEYVNPIFKQVADAKNKVIVAVSSTLACALFAVMMLSIIFCYRRKRCCWGNMKLFKELEDVELN